MEFTESLVFSIVLHVCKISLLLAKVSFDKIAVGWKVFLPTTTHGSPPQQQVLIRPTPLIYNAGNDTRKLHIHHTPGSTLDPGPNWSQPIVARELAILLRGTLVTQMQMSSMGPLKLLSYNTLGLLGISSIQHRHHAREHHMIVDSMMYSIGSLFPSLSRVRQHPYVI